MPFQRLVAQALLVIRSERVGGVAAEGQMIGRVGVDEVAWLGRDSQIGTAGDGGLSKRGAAGAEVASVKNGGLAVAAHRDVELAPAIDPPQSVVAGAIEIDEARGGFDGVAVRAALGPHFVVLILAMRFGELREAVNEEVRMALYHTPCGAEIWVDVGQAGAVGTQVKIEGASAKEGLPVGAESVRKESLVSLDQAAFAARPFDEWARLFSTSGCAVGLRRRSASPYYRIAWMSKCRSTSPNRSVSD